MRVSLQKLEVLTRVVELGGIGRAADDLHVVQPAVTAHIRSLESLVGAQLLERTGRHVSLTPAGRVAYLWAEDVGARTLALERELDGLRAGTSGRAFVGADPAGAAHLLPPVLERFVRDHPDAEVQLVSADADRLVRDLHEHTIDLALVAGRERPWSPELAVSWLGVTEHVLVGSRRAPAAEAIHAAQLADLPFVDAHDGLLPPGVAKHGVLRIVDPEARKRVVLETDSLTVLPRAAVRAELAAGRLRAVAILDLDLRIPVWLVHRADHAATPLQARLVGALRDALTS